MTIHGLTEIIGAAALGEEWAWSRLYDVLAPQLLGYFRARGTREAEDLVGETFVQLARNLRSFEGSAESFRSWVFMIAHNRLSNNRRRHARKPELLLDPVSLAQSIDAAVVHERSAELSLEEALHLLDGLTPEQRDIIALRFIADLSVHEVAEILKISKGAVKQSTRRALVRLRTNFATGPVTQ